jgi:hypothetical protein
MNFYPILKEKDLNNTANVRPHSTTANKGDEDTVTCRLRKMYKR